MSQSRIKMSDFIAFRQENPFFEMPQDSLIKLSAHRPVWNKILSYLRMSAKKNLRLANPREFKDIIRRDPTWIWTVNLGPQIQYPDFFYNSTTKIKLNFPKLPNGRFYPNLDLSDQMIELIKKIKPRIVGLAVHQVTLNSYSHLLRIEGLKSIEIEESFNEDLSEAAVQLFATNYDCLQEIYLKVLNLSAYSSHMLNIVTLHNVIKLRLIRITGDISHLLRACTNVQELNVNNTTFYSFLNEDFSLPHLTKLSLKKVKMTTRDKNTLKAKLPETLKLEDCMDKHCTVCDEVF